jgi:hypothetical protein
MGMARKAPAAVSAAINEAYTVIRRDVEGPMFDNPFSFITHHRYYL